MQKAITLVEGKLEIGDFYIPYHLAVLHIQCFKLDEVRGQFIAHPMMKTEHRQEAHHISEGIKEAVLEYQGLGSSRPTGLLSSLRSIRWRQARERREQYDEMNEEEWYTIEFESSHFFTFKAHGRIAFAVSMRPSVFKKAQAFQRKEPVYLGSGFRLEEGKPEGKVWWYGDEFWMSTGYSEQEARVHLEREQGGREERKRQRLERATAVTTKPGRKTIPKEVRLLVWERDGSRCVNCGSTQDLEFDHIIPVSRGGSNIKGWQQYRVEFADSVHYMQSEKKGSHRVALLGAEAQGVVGEEVEGDQRGRERRKACSRLGCDTRRGQDAQGHYGVR